MRETNVANFQKNFICLYGQNLPYTLAYRVARKHGMTPEDAKDCAITFAEHTYFELTRRSFGSTSMHFPHTWLIRCARNWVIDHQRRIWKQHQHEHSLADVLVELAKQDPAARGTSLHRDLFLAELQNCIARAVLELTPQQQHLWNAHVSDNRSIRELAAESGRSEHSLRQSLSNIRKRLRSVLEHQGLDESSAREYVHLISEQIITARQRSAVPFQEHEHYLEK